MSAVRDHVTHLVQVIYRTINDGELPNDAVKALQFQKAIIDEVPSEYRDTAQIELDSQWKGTGKREDDWAEAVLQFSYLRPPTTAEVLARIHHYIDMQKHTLYRPRSIPRRPDSADQIKAAIEEAEALRAEFTQLKEMEDAAAATGLTQFKVVCDETINSTDDIDQNRLNVNVTLVRAPGDDRDELWDRLKATVKATEEEKYLLIGRSLNHDFSGRRVVTISSDGSLVRVLSDKATLYDVEKLISTLGLTVLTTWNQLYDLKINLEDMGIRTSSNWDG